MRNTESRVADPCQCSDDIKGAETFRLAAAARTASASRCQGCSMRGGGGRPPRDCFSLIRPELAESLRLDVGNEHTVIQAKILAVVAAMWKWRHILMVHGARGVVFFVDSDAAR